jgi:hypothetical protein
MIGLCILLLTGLSLWFSAAVLTCGLRIRSPSGRVLAWMVLAYAQMILVALALSWPRLVTSSALCATHLMIAGLAAVVWVWAGRPALLPGLGAALHRLARIVRAQPALWILAPAVALAGATCVFLVLYVPPNNWDSMTCHLARAAFWMQYHRVGDYFTHNPLQNDYPQGASIAQLYTLISMRSDLLPGFVQFGAWIGAGLAIYGLARQLGYRPGHSLQAALIALLLPQFILQATSTQTDLLFAFTVVAAAYFLLLAARSARNGPLLLACVSLGLVCGTKGSAPLYGPLFAACLIAWSLIAARQPGRFIGKVVVVGAICVGLLGAESYVNNLIKYGALAKPNGTPRSHRNDPLQVRANLVRCGVAAFELPFRTPYTLEADFSKLRKMRRIGAALGVNVDDATDWRTQPLEEQTSHTIQEDLAWYGLAGFFLLPLAQLLALLGVQLRPPSAWRRAALAVLLATSAAAAVTISLAVALCLGLSAALLVMIWRQPAAGFRAGRWFLAASVVGTLLLSLALYMYISSIGRYMLPLAALAAANVPAVLRMRRGFGAAIGLFAAALAVTQAVDVFLHNERKPLVASEVTRRIQLAPASIFDLSRAQRRQMVRGYMVDLAAAVEARRPKVERLGYLSRGGDSWDFVFFGPELRRELVVLDWRGDWVRELDARRLDDALLIEVPFDVPPEWTVVEAPTPGRTALLRRNPKLVRVEAALSSSVDLSGSPETAWPVEQTVAGAPFLWLGHGVGEGLGFALDCRQAGTLTLEATMAPGPGRSDTLRNLVMTCDGQEVWQSGQDGPGRISVPLKLTRGPHSIRLYCTDEATIRRYPNGDTRSLLIRIDSLRILPTRQES